MEWLVLRLASWTQLVLSFERACCPQGQIYWFDIDPISSFLTHLNTYELSGKLIELLGISIQALIAHFEEYCIWTFLGTTRKKKIKSSSKFTKCECFVKPNKQTFVISLNQYFWLSNFFKSFLVPKRFAQGKVVRNIFSSKKKKKK